MHFNFHLLMTHKQYKSQMLKKRVELKSCCRNNPASNFQNVTLFNFFHSHKLYVENFSLYSDKYDNKDVILVQPKLT